MVSCLYKDRYRATQLAMYFLVFVLIIFTYFFGADRTIIWVFFSRSFLAAGCSACTTLSPTQDTVRTGRFTLIIALYVHWTSVPDPPPWKRPLLVLSTIDEKRAISPFIELVSENFITCFNDQFFVETFYTWHNHLMETDCWIRLIHTTQEKDPGAIST